MIVASGPLGLGLLALLFGLWAFHRWAPEAASVFRSTAVVWSGRAILLAVTGLGLVGLVEDIDQVL